MCFSNKCSICLSYGINTMSCTCCKANRIHTASSLTMFEGWTKRKTSIILWYKMLKAYVTFHLLQNTLPMQNIFPCNLSQWFTYILYSRYSFNNQIGSCLGLCVYYESALMFLHEYPCDYVSTRASLKYCFQLELYPYSILLYTSSSLSFCSKSWHLKHTYFLILELTQFGYEREHDWGTQQIWGLPAQ